MSEPPPTVSGPRAALRSRKCRTARRLPGDLDAEVRRFLTGFSERPIGAPAVRRLTAKFDTGPNSGRRRRVHGDPLWPRAVVTVAGKLNDSSFQQAKKALEFLADAEPGLTANVMSLLPIDYDLLVQRLLPDAFPSVAKHIGPVLCYRGDPQDPDASAYIGGVDALLAWCREEYAYEDATHKIFYERLAKTHMRGVAEKTAGVLRLGRRGGRHHTRHAAR